MASSSFSAVMRSIFLSEGGYADHPHDPGGVTKFGITIGTLRSHRRAPVTRSDVRRLSKAEAVEIYRRRYWIPASGPDLPVGIDLAVMDAAVNSGPRRAVRWAARAINADVPKTMTPVLVSGLLRAPVSRTINRMLDDRLAWLRTLSHWNTFGRGWTRRIRRVRAESLELARRNTGRDVAAVSAPLAAGAEREPALHDALGTNGPLLSGAVLWIAIAGALASLAWWHRAWVAARFDAVRYWLEDLLAAIRHVGFSLDLAPRFRELRAELRRHGREFVDEAGDVVRDIEEAVR